MVEGAAGFFDAAVSEALAGFEGGGEALAGEFVFAEAEVRDAAEMETVGFAPGILAVRRFRTVERVASVLEGFVGVPGGEVGFGEGEAEVDGEFSEAAGVGEEDAGFGFGDGLREIAEMAVEFACGVEAAELEVDYAGAGGEGAGVFEVLDGSGGIVGKEEPGEEGMAQAEVVVRVFAGCEFQARLCLAECSEPVAAQELTFGLPDGEGSKRSARLQVRLRSGVS